MQKQTTIVRPVTCSPVASSPVTSPVAARRAGRPLTVLTLQERRVIALLRSACADDAFAQAREDRGSEAILEALEGLATQVLDNDLVVFTPQSRFVSEDELAILSWLSMLQRPSQSADWRMANPFQQALRAFADRLLREERRLPARSMLAEARIERDDCFRIELRSDPAPDTVPDAGAESAEAKALALVEHRRFATTSQFRALGISTQKLSRLCRRGYVERVALGLYKKPGSSAAIAAS